AAAKLAAIFADYQDSTLQLKQIREKHGLTEAQLRWLIQSNNWPRRNLRGLDRGAIINRMFRLLERQILNLENSMTTTGEKEVGVLSSLVGTLGKLIALETGATKPRKSEETKEMLDIRDKLVRRIEQLKR